VAAGEPPEQRYPGIAAHLHACGPCGEDYDGLLAALRDETPRLPHVGPPSAGLTPREFCESGVRVNRGVQEAPSR
jgi:hypothetical protein